MGLSKNIVLIVGQLIMGHLTHLTNFFSLTEEEPQGKITEDDAEQGTTIEDEACEIFPGSLKHTRITISPARNLRFKSEFSQQIRCDQCSFETGNIRYLNKHKRSEHNEFEFFCPFCIFITEKKRSIMSHINRQHPWKNCSFDS